MSQPDPYEPLHDYGLELGTTHGGNLDQDFEDVSRATKETNANLALIQRDDTKLRNKTVHPDALSAGTLALIAGWTPKGLWATATLYAVKDLVEQGGRGYVCAVEHVSGTFNTDHGSGKWIVLDSSDGAVSYFAAATGTGDAMVVDLPVIALSDGLEIRVRAVGANTVTNPTIAVGSVAAKTIVKGGGGVLVAADYGLGQEITLRYRASTDKFELLNPLAGAAPGTVAASKGVVVDANKDIGSFRNHRATRYIRGEGAATSYNTAGNITYTAAEILSGTIVRDPNGGARSDVLPTAALLVGALPGAAVGDIIDCLIVNGADAAETITIGAGSGGGFDANQVAASRIIPQNASKTMKIRLTNVTGAAEAYVVYL